MTDFEPERCPGCPNLRAQERRQRDEEERRSRFESDFYGEKADAKARHKELMDALNEQREWLKRLFNGEFVSKGAVP